MYIVISRAITKKIMQRGIFTIMTNKVDSKNKSSRNSKEDKKRSEK